MPRRTPYTPGRPALPSLRRARSILHEPSPADAPPAFTVGEVEQTALSSRNQAIRLFKAVEAAAELSHDAYVEHVLEREIGPMLAERDEWNPIADGEQKTAVRELARLRVYFREVVRLTFAPWEISHVQQHYTELLEAAHLVVPSSSSEQRVVMARFTAPLVHFRSGYVGAYAVLRDYVIQSVNDRTIAAVAHEHATAALADLTFATMRACAKLRFLMDSHGLGQVDRALAAIGPNWWESGPDHERGQRPEEERNPYSVPRPDLDFQFLYWRSELFLAMRRQL